MPNTHIAIIEGEGREGNGHLILLCLAKLVHDFFFFIGLKRASGQV